MKITVIRIPTEVGGTWRPGYQFETDWLAGLRGVRFDRRRCRTYAEALQWSGEFAITFCAEKYPSAELEMR